MNIYDHWQKKILNKKDDADLFELANNFCIRHFNQLQQDQYNKPIWYIPITPQDAIFNIPSCGGL